MLAFTPRRVFVRLRGFLKQEAALVASILLIVGGLWTFAAIVDEIEDGEIEELDAWVIDVLHHSDIPNVPIGPDWLITAALNATSLGSTAVLAIMLVLVTGYLGLQREYRSMWLVIVASVLGQVISSSLKYAFDRERPDEMLHLAEVATASFPSGHATLGAIVYLTLGAVLASTRSKRGERIYIMGAALVITGIVGLSRIYIGVHYATDVLGGWSIGLCWALLCLMVARELQRQPASNGQPLLHSH